MTSITQIQGSVNNLNANVNDNTQYILDWIAAGGDQSENNGDAGGYSIPDNNIGFHFTDPCNNNISIRDAQYLLNWSSISSETTIASGTNYLNDIQYTVSNYKYPESADFINLVVYETDNGNIVNQIYLKQKNSFIIKPSYSDIDLNKHILANCIPYLRLKNDKGSMITRNDTSNNIEIMKRSINTDGVIEYDPSTSISHQSSTPNSLYIFPPKEDIKSLLQSYTYVNIANSIPDSGNTNYLTSLRTRNANNITIPNWGVQSVDLTTATNNNAHNLSTIQTFSPSTHNMLSPLNFNKTNWIVPGNEINTTQGHNVGQFVFTPSAEGIMIYQYYYSVTNEDVLPGSGSDNNSRESPFNVYFNIKEGYLRFPPKWPSIATKTIIQWELQHYSSWCNNKFSCPSILANIYADMFKNDSLLFIYNTESNVIEYAVWENLRVVNKSAELNNNTILSMSNVSCAALWEGHQSTTEQNILINSVYMANAMLRTISSIDTEETIYIQGDIENDPVNPFVNKHIISWSGSEDTKWSSDHITPAKIISIYLGKNLYIFENGFNAMFNDDDNNNLFNNLLNLENINLNNLNNLPENYDLTNELNKSYLETIIIPKYVPFTGLNLAECNKLKTLIFLGSNRIFWSSNTTNLIPTDTIPNLATDIIDDIAIWDESEWISIHWKNVYDTLHSRLVLLNGYLKTIDFNNLGNLSLQDILILYTTIPIGSLVNRILDTIYNRLSTTTDVLEKNDLISVKEEWEALIEDYNGGYYIRQTYNYLTYNIWSIAEELLPSSLTTIYYDIKYAESWYKWLDIPIIKTYLQTNSIVVKSIPYNANIPGSNN